MKVFEQGCGKIRSVLWKDWPCVMGVYGLSKEKE